MREFPGPYQPTNVPPYQRTTLRRICAVAYQLMEAACIYRQQTFFERFSTRCVFTQPFLAGKWHAQLYCVILYLDALVSVYIHALVYVQEINT